jgi:hypothetical protein
MRSLGQLAPAGPHRLGAAQPATGRALYLRDHTRLPLGIWLQSLRDLPDMEKLEEAGLLSRSALAELPGVFGSFNDQDERDAPAEEVEVGEMETAIDD